MITAKFKVLAKPLLLQPTFTIIVVRAVCTLHNYVRLSEKGDYGAQYASSRMGSFISKNKKTREGYWRKTTARKTALEKINYRGDNIGETECHFIRDNLSEYLREEFYIPLTKHSKEK